jgi:hypothetical protein
VSRCLIGDAKHFWQKRYYDFNIRDRFQFIEAALFSSQFGEGPEEWEWSSFGHYATGCEGRVEIESEWTAGKRERTMGRRCPRDRATHSSQKQARWAIFLTPKA